MWYATLCFAILFSCALTNVMFCMNMCHLKSEKLMCLHITTQKQLCKCMHIWYTLDKHMQTYIYIYIYIYIKTERESCVYIYIVIIFIYRCTCIHIYIYTHISIYIYMVPTPKSPPFSLYNLLLGNQRGVLYIYIHTYTYICMCKAKCLWCIYVCMYESINVVMFMCQHIFLPMNLQFWNAAACTKQNQENKRKTKKQNKQNLTDNFWLGAQRSFFCFPWVFFCFLFLNRKPKKTLCFLFFCTLCKQRRFKKPKKHELFLVFHQKLCPKPNLKFWKTKQNLVFFVVELSLLPP